MNMLLKKLPELDCMKNFPGKIIPMLWLDEVRQSLSPKRYVFDAQNFTCFRV